MAGLSVVRVCCGASSAFTSREENHAVRVKKNPGGLTPAGFPARGTFSCLAILRLLRPAQSAARRLIIAAEKRSYTGQFLKELLGHQPGKWAQAAE